MGWWKKLVPKIEKLHDKLDPLDAKVQDAVLGDQEKQEERIHKWGPAIGAAAAAFFSGGASLGATGAVEAGAAGAGTAAGAAGATGGAVAAGEGAAAAGGGASSMGVMDWIKLGSQASDLVGGLSGKEQRSPQPEVKQTRMLTQKESEAGCWVNEDGTVSCPEKSASTEYSANWDKPKNSALDNANEDDYSSAWRVAGK